MKGKWMRMIGGLALAAMMMMTAGTGVYAEEVPAPAEWQGDGISCQVTAGHNGYTFLSVYPGRAYEMSNHMVSGGEGDSIPQTLVMIDASGDHTWIPDGIYTFGSSNYEVLYCCDADTSYHDQVYYKRMNLEDSDYYDEEDAAHIRGIITNAYPYVSLEQMKENLAAEGFTEAAQLTRADVIAAVQMAVWAYANEAGELGYSKTFDVPSNPQWGTVFHDYTSEMDVWWDTGKRVMSADETVGARIDALAEHLKSQEKIYADVHQIVITDLTILGAVPDGTREDLYQVSMEVKLNNGGSSEQDEIGIQVCAAGSPVASAKARPGQNVYTLTFPVKAGEVVEAVVSGVQILPEGVYFYQPEGGRSSSQSLVGVAAGPTSIYARAETIPVPPAEPIEPPAVPTAPPYWPPYDGGSVTPVPEAPVSPPVEPESPAEEKPDTETPEPEPADTPAEADSVTAIPKTGDSSGILTWTILALFAVCALVERRCRK